MPLTKEECSKKERVRPHVELVPIENYTKFIEEEPKINCRHKQSKNIKTLVSDRCPSD